MRRTQEAAVGTPTPQPAEQNGSDVYPRLVHVNNQQVTVRSTVEQSTGKTGTDGTVVTRQLHTG